MRESGGIGGLVILIFKWKSIRHFVVTLNYCPKKKGNQKTNSRIILQVKTNIVNNQIEKIAFSVLLVYQLTPFSFKVTSSDFVFEIASALQHHVLNDSVLRSLL